MGKAITVFSLIILSMLLLRCKNPPGIQAFYLNYNFIGVMEGNTVKFYETKDLKTWKYSPNKDFVSPEPINNVFYFGTSFIGVRHGRRVKFYKTNSQGTWNYSFGNDF